MSNNNQSQNIAESPSSAPAQSAMSKQTRQGIIYAVCAYGIWGTLPVYFQQIRQVNAYEILAHRIIWSFVFMLLLVSITRHWGKVRAVLRQPKTCMTLGVTSFLVGTNWLIYIWAVNSHHMLEASLGYFINPLFNVILGIVFLGERLRILQWCAVGLALIGVLVQLLGFGSIPVVALGLALTFGFYGLLRKKIGVDGQSGMLLETLWLLPFASLYMLAFAQSPTSSLSENPLLLNFFLVCAGVITTVPLLFFNGAATRLPLSSIAFFQYISPSLVFILAVLVYKETLSTDKLITFAFIWAALALFSFDALKTQRGNMRRSARAKKDSAPSERR